MRNKLEEATKLAIEGKLQESEQPTTLEDVLKMLGASEPFDANGKLSEEGSIAEKKLYDLLNGLKNLNIIDFDADRYDKEIDNIINE